MKPADSQLEHDLSQLTTVEEVIAYVKAEYGTELNVSVTGDVIHVDYRRWDSADLCASDPVSYLKGFLMGMAIQHRRDWYDSPAADE